MRYLILPFVALLLFEYQTPESLADDVIRFLRVEYDMETTIKKIYDEPDLDNMLGDRLRHGR